MTKTRDKAALDQWYVVENLALIGAAPRHARLLGQDIVLRREAGGGLVANELADDGRIGAPLPVQERYGHAWTTFGAPARDIIAIPETDEPDRRMSRSGAVMVKASGLRVVENFLDMAHFPFVHTDILGSESHTEVLAYRAEIRRDVDELWATDCKFYQPRPSMAATEGVMIDYVYRCGSPFVTMLYKTNVLAKNRWDIICLFVQPLEEDLSRVHPVNYLLDRDTPDATLIQFQQLVFLQDRIILENQRPRLLPLEPRAEIPTRADIASVAYRRWLKEKGLRYGTAENDKACA
jgi:phenylpropionate dioxygenase-like ring-hydroxylating dioxygenase large terminal subunit